MYLDHLEDSGAKIFYAGVVPKSYTLRDKLNTQVTVIRFSGERFDPISTVLLCKLPKWS